MGSDILSQPTNVSTRRVTWVSRRKTGRIFVYDIAHCLKGGVHIGVERDGYVGVSEQPRESGCVAAEADAVGHKGVPLRYNYDKPEKPRISRVFGYLARFFILFQTEKSSREVVIS